jgi:hypothetical protein
MGFASSALWGVASGKSLGLRQSEFSLCSTSGDAPSRRGRAVWCGVYGGFVVGVEAKKKARYPSPSTMLRVRMTSLMVRITILMSMMRGRRVRNRVGLVRFALLYIKRE